MRNHINLITESQTVSEGKNLAPKGMNSHQRKGWYDQQGGKSLTDNPFNPVAQPWSHTQWGKGWLAAEEAEVSTSDHVEEGWKSALGGAAMGAAAMATAIGANPEPNYDEMSFSSAFAQALQDKGEGEVFSWRGKTYTLNTQAAKPEIAKLRRDDGKPIHIPSDEEYKAEIRAKLKEEFDNIDEGWKSAALGAAAMGAAAMAGLNATKADTQPQSTSIEQLAPMKFSAEAEQVAKQQGFESAEAMYYFMKNRSQGATIEIDQFDKALASAKGASMIAPGNLLKYVSDKMDKATKK